MRRLAALLAGAALMLITTSALATPISGSINFSGGLNLIGPAQTTTQNATGIDFVNPSLVTTGATGTYASVPGFPPFVTFATFQDFTFSPVLSPSPVSPLWTLTLGSTTFDFILASVTATPVSPNGLLLNGTGTLRATGFDDTLGSWSLTTQDSQAAVLSFSAASSVPEPGTMILLGAGFLGLAIYGKRRKNA